MTSQPMQKQVGLVATFTVGKGWEQDKRGLPLPKELETEIFLRGKAVPKPYHVAHPFAVGLVGGGWWDMGAPLPKHNALKDEQPSADKSKRHPLAQAWRDAKPGTPSTEGDEVFLLTEGEMPLLLSAGATSTQLLIEKILKPQPTLRELSDMERRGEKPSWIIDYTESTDKPCLPRIRKAEATIEQPDMTVLQAVIESESEPRPVESPDKMEALALEAIGSMEGYPVGQFMGEYGVPVLNSLLDQNLIVVKKDHIYVFAPAPTQPLAVPVQPVSTSPAKPKAKAVDIFAQAQEHKRLMKNNTEAYKVAREIRDNGNAVGAFLADFGIHSGTPVSDDLLVQVQAAVTQEKLQYVSATTRATLDVYGSVIHGEIAWTGCKSTGANKYSKGRTRFFDRVYEEQALVWLEELKRKPMSPVQVLEVGKRLDAIRQGNLRVSNAAGGSRRIH